MNYYPQLKDEKLRQGEFRSPLQGQEAWRPWSRNTGQFCAAPWTTILPVSTARAAHSSPGHSRAGPRVGRPNRSPRRSLGGHLRPVSPHCPDHQPSYSISVKSAGSCVLRPGPPAMDLLLALPAFFSPPPLFSGFLLHLPSGTIGSPTPKLGPNPEYLVPNFMLGTLPVRHYRGPWWPPCLCTHCSRHMLPLPLTLQDKVSINTLPCCPFSMNEAAPWPQPDPVALTLLSATLTRMCAHTAPLSQRTTGPRVP